MAYKDFAPAQILTAQEVDTYLMRQAVMSFATSTARDAAITTPVEGMVAYLEDSNTFWFYNGSAWQNVGNVMRFASAATRTSALPSPVEGMVSYLQDTDELQVYNGASWLTVVVTSDDEGFSTTGSVIANTGGADGGFALRSYTGAGSYQSLATANMTGNEYVIATDGGDTYISAGSGNQIYLRPSANSTTGQVNINTTNTTTPGNLTVSKRDPILRIEETGGADNVDIELAQSGVALTGGGEGLRIRYESGTGHSRITNVYGAGDLYLHSANSTGTGLRIASNGLPYNVAGLFPSGLGAAGANAGQITGSMRLASYGHVTTSSTINVGAAWVNMLGVSGIAGSSLNNSWICVLFRFSCYMNGTGAHRSKIVIERNSDGAVWSQQEAYHFFNTAYQHQDWTNFAVLQVPQGVNFNIRCQVIGFTTISFDSNDSYSFQAYIP